MFLSLHNGVDADGFFSGTISVHSLQVVSFREGPGLGSVDCAPDGTVVVAIGDCNDKCEGDCEGNCEGERVQQFL